MALLGAAILATSSSAQVIAGDGFIVQPIEESFAEAPTTASEYFVAIPIIRVVLHTNTIGLDTLVWCNAVFEYGDEQYYGSGQLQPVTDGGYVDCTFPYAFLNKTHVAGAVHFWASTTYIGAPFVLDTGATAEAWVSYP